MKKSIVFAFALFFVTAALSGAPSYTFRHYTVRDGLSSNTVRTLIQDRQGLVWFGTGSGLDSFDGREVIHHELPAGRSSYVNALYEGGDGSLWIGTDDAVYRYGDEAPFRIPDFPEAIVTVFAEDRDGNLWIGTIGQGVYRYAGETLTHFLETETIEALFLSKDGRLWAADPGAEDGLYVFNPAAGAFVSPGLRFEGVSPTRVCAIDQDGDGTLWLGTWDRGLYCLDPATRTVRGSVPAGKGLNHIHSLMQVSPWNFLVGSDDGLLWVNPLTGEQALFGNDRKDPTSLSNKFVYPVRKDHEGGIWVGTYYGGVNYVSPGAGQFTSESLSDLVNAGEDYILSCFCEDPDGSLWMGSDNGGLFHYDPVTGKAEQWRSPLPSGELLSSLNIHALLRRGDDLWIGTYADNLIRLDLKTGRVKTYTPEDGLDAHSIYALHESPGDTLWAGTNLGICRFDAVRDCFVEEYGTGEVVGDIARDAGGNLWFATAGKGLFRRFPDGTWEDYSGQEGSLPAGEVHCLLPSARGLYAGTRNGLALLGASPETFLEGTEILYAAADGGSLWLSTPSELIRFSPESGEQESFGQNDGVLHNLFLPGSGLVSREGRIYMGASDGFVSFYPGSVVENQAVPTVLFTRFYASGPGVTEDVFSSQGLDNARIPWRERDLRITFAALSYCAPEKVRFAYRLEGRDAHWRPLGNQNELVLNQLPAGRYRLRVIACNNSGVWNREGATLSFSIRPHPLLSSVALLLYVLAAGALFFFLVRWLLRRAERRTRVRFEQRLDEAVSHVKEEERDDRYQFISTLSDQLEAPIVGIGTQLERLHPGEDDAATREGLAVIEKNHRMLRNVAAGLRQMRTALLPEADGEASVSSAEEDFLTRLNRIIGENLSNPDLSVAFLAREMAISRSGLFSKVKELSGETPNNLINQARLNAAAKLLSEGRHSVGEICYMTGFSSPSYFSKSFTAQFGISPHEWIRMHKE